MRPRYCSFSGATTSWILRLPQLASIAHRVLVAARLLVELRQRGVVFEQRQLLVEREAHGVFPTRHGVEDEPRTEREVHREAHRHRERDDAPAVLARVRARLELLFDVGHVLAVDAEHVPVERPLRGRRHRGHQLDRPRLERSDHRDELERRALELADGASRGRGSRRATRTATAPCARRRRCACAPTTTRSPSRRRRGRRAATRASPRARRASPRARWTPPPSPRDGSRSDRP